LSFSMHITYLRNYIKFYKKQEMKEKKHPRQLYCQCRWDGLKPVRNTGWLSARTMVQ
jgi:hypothetical protein